MSAPAHWRDAATNQLNFLLFVEFVVYCVLDIWPYATYFSSPADPSSDPVTWVRVALLALSTFIIPLMTPNPYRPSTPGAKPSEEDTASLLSAYSFSFLDKVVFYANRVGNVTPEDMPEVTESDRIETLSKRAFKSLDPVQNGKRNVIWGAAWVWSE